MIIKKGDMSSRVNAAIGAAPSITARFSQATAGINEHPTARPPAGASAELTGKTEAPGKPRYVTAPIDLIDETPLNARCIYRPERVQEIAVSLGQNGQETPGFATMRNGRYVLGAGGYRIRGLKLLKAKEMDLKVWDDLTDRELYELSFRENNEREGQSAYDNAVKWRQLLDTSVYANETELAQATGFSLSNVNKTLGSLRLSAAVRSLVEEDPSVFKLSVLYELALYEEVGGQEKTIALARQVIEGAIGRKQIQDARALEVHHKPRKTKEQSRQYQIGGAGLERGVLKEWDSGKITLEIEASDPSKRVYLVEQLKKLFEAAE